MAQATTVTPLDHLVKVLKLGEPSVYRNHTYINGESMYFPTGRVYGGQVIAQAVLLIETATLTHDQIATWGWRIAFGIGGLAAVVVLWMRRTMDESLTEEHLENIRTGLDRDSGTMRTLLVDHWQPLLLVFLITMGGTVCFYTYSVNAPAIVKSTFKEIGRAHV